MGSPAVEFGHPKLYHWADALDVQREHCTPCRALSLLGRCRLPEFLSLCAACYLVTPLPSTPHWYAYTHCPGRIDDHGRNRHFLLVFHSWSNNSARSRYSDRSDHWYGLYPSDTIVDLLPAVASRLHT